MLGMSREGNPRFLHSIIDEDSLCCIIAQLKGSRFPFALTCRAARVAVEAFAKHGTAVGAAKSAAPTAAITSRHIITSIEHCECVYRLEMLEWAISAGARVRALAAAAAVASPLNFDVVVFLHENGCVLRDSLTPAVLRRTTTSPVLAGVCSTAAFQGNMTVLVWARRLGYARAPEVCAAAAAAGNVDVLNWLIDGGCQLDSTACTAAAANGHIDVLAWLLDNNFHWDSHASVAAAKNGRMDVLAWLRANNLPLDDNLFVHAAGSGHTHVLEWIHAHDFDWVSDVDDLATGWYAAADGGHVHVLEWLQAHDVAEDPDWRPAVNDGVVDDRHLSVLNWLRAHCHTENPWWQMATA